MAEPRSCVTDTCTPPTTHDLLLHAAVVLNTRTYHAPVRGNVATMRVRARSPACAARGGGCIRAHSRSRGESPTPYDQNTNKKALIMIGSYSEAWRIAMHCKVGV
jgi:hypothetical protein